MASANCSSVGQEGRNCCLHNSPRHLWSIMFFWNWPCQALPCIRATGKLVIMAVTPASPTTKEHASVVLLLKVTPSTAAELDDYRASLRPVPSRASVLRAALTEYLKRQGGGRRPAVPAPAVRKSWR